MISSLSAASQSFLLGLGQIQTRMQNAQQQLSSGLKLSVASDDPSQVPLLMQTRSSLNHINQIGSNLSQVSAEVNGAQNGLQSAVTLVEKAQSLASEAQPTTTSADNRQQIAGQLGSILQQLVGVANTSVGGRYVFSGDSDQTAPYSIDLTQNNPVSAYAGSASTRQIELPDGSNISIAETAQTIFDSPDPQSNVFQAINSVRLALLNNDQTGIDAGIPVLKSADTYLNTQLAFYGSAQSQISNAQSAVSAGQTQLQTQLSNIQDADMAEAITEFTQAQTQEQAALTSEAQMPRTSLFSYLG